MTWYHLFKFCNISRLCFWDVVLSHVFTHFPRALVCAGMLQNSTSVSSCCILIWIINIFQSAVVFPPSNHVILCLDWFYAAPLISKWNLRYSTFCYLLSQPGCGGAISPFDNATSLNFIHFSFESDILKPRLCPSLNFGQSLASPVIFSPLFHRATLWKTMNNTITNVTGFWQQHVQL